MKKIDKKYIIFLALLFSFSALFAQNPKAPPPLNTLIVPEPSNLMAFVKDKDKAIELGKAFFWDMQAGGDGVQACASCHFNAGADIRFKNQISPGLNGGNAAFDPTGSGGSGGPNYTAVLADFPFHRLSDPEDRFSTLEFDTDDVFSSMGVHNAQFDDIIPSSPADANTSIADPFGFSVGGFNTRKVEPRNTPTVINAVFNVENFWDGRAKFFFNGVNPFGKLDPSARILEKQPGGNVIQAAIAIDRASLASQAVGPPLSGFEMSASGRNFPKLAKKLLSLKPLGLQVVDPTDSRLGHLADAPKGLTAMYADMIRAAFHDKYWDSPKIFDVNKNEIAHPAGSTDEYSLMEMNFALFWGLAIQCYEATLVSDQTPFDDFQSGDMNALTEQQQIGLEIFVNQGRCINCHSGPEFTNATIDQRIDNPVIENGNIEGVIERMAMAQGQALYDGGFYNIGVRPTGEDIGRGGAALGLPLSFTRLAKLNGQAALEAELGFGVGVDPPIPAGSTERDAVDGAFKTPGLRNVELTGPYFHNGGQADLLQVVLFYTRGGDFHEANIDNLDPDIISLGHIKGHLDRAKAVAEFMKALTDERVRYNRAPFDHPQLFVANGHPGDENSVLNDGVKANDDFLELPAVGASGRSTPIMTAFLNQNTWNLNPDNNNPVCQITGINAGPPLSVDLLFADSESGLARLEVVTLINAQIEIPVGSGNFLTSVGETAFLAGINSVAAQASKIDNGKSATVVVRVVDGAGNSVLCDPVYTTIGSNVPLSYDLKQNFPNPFNPATTIHFDVAAANEGPTPVKLTVFDVLGRTVKTLINERLEAAKYQVQWDGTNSNGVVVSGGIYFYRLTAGHFTSTKKMVFMK